MNKRIVGVLGAIALVGVISFHGVRDLNVKRVAEAQRALGKSVPSDKDPINQAIAIEEARKVADALKEIRAKRQQGNPGGNHFGLKRGQGYQVPNVAQQQEINNILQVLPGSTILHMDNFQGTLRHLRGDLSALSERSLDYQNAKRVGSYEDMAFALLGELGGVTGLNDPSSAFRVSKVNTDQIGMTHISLSQQIEGIPVWGADIKVHLNADSYH